MSRTGTIGERLFKLWCSQADITCNQAHEDNVGWDFRLDFPLPDRPNLQDIHKGAPHCLIQVKTTRTKSSRSIPLKLSNMYRHATVLEPVFVVLIRIDANKRPKECHIVHIGRSLMERALAQIANASQDCESTEIHKERFYVSPKEAHTLPECNGAAVRKAVLKFIGENISEYVEKKRVTLDQLGYPELSTKLSFSINSKRNLRHFLLACLGKEQETKVQDVTIQTERFGRTDESLSHHQLNATLLVKPEAPISTGSLIISTGEYGPFCEFSAEFFALPFLSHVDDNMPAYRILAGPIEIIINKSYSKAQLHLSFDYKSPAQFSKIERFGRLLTILFNSEGSPHIKLQMANCQDWRQIIHIPEAFSEEHNWIQNDAELIANAASLFQYFEVDPDTFISMEQLISAQSSIATYANLVSGRRVAFKVVFDVDKATNVSYSEAVYVSRLALRVGNIAMGLIISISGRIVFESGRDLTLYSQNLEIAQKVVGFLPDNRIDSKLSKLVQELASSLENERDVIVDADAVKHARG